MSSITSSSRVVNAGCLLLTILTTSLEAIKCVHGIALSILSIAKLESDRNISRKALINTRKLATVPSYLFGYLLKTINPNAAVVFDTGARNGFCSSRTSEKLFYEATNNYKQNDFLKKYVISRALFALGGLVSIVTRTADFAIGLVAATFSLLTLGRVQRLNDFAYGNLIFPTVIFDVALGIRGLINPLVGEHYRALHPLPPVSKVIPQTMHDDIVLSKYICTITQEPMRDPVADPTNGGKTLYERAAIVKWLQTKNTSPATRFTLNDFQLLERPALSALINSRLKLHSRGSRNKKPLNLNAPADPVLQAAADAEEKKILDHYKLLESVPQAQVIGFRSPGR